MLGTSTQTAARMGTKVYEKAAEKLRERGKENAVTSERTVHTVVAVVTFALAATAAFQAFRSLRRALAAD